MYTRLKDVRAGGQVLRAYIMFIPFTRHTDSLVTVRARRISAASASARLCAVIFAGFLPDAAEETIFREFSSRWETDSQARGILSRETRVELARAFSRIFPTVCAAYVRTRTGNIKVPAIYMRDRVQRIMRIFIICDNIITLAMCECNNDTFIFDI